MLSNDPQPTKVGIIGYTGKLGRHIMAIATGSGCDAVAFVGKDHSRILASPDVFIVTSFPCDIRHAIELCTNHSSDMLVCSSGLTPDDEAALAAAAQHLRILRATNLSLGYEIQRRLTEVLSTILPACANTEVAVIDRHTIQKKDAPSASARSLSALIEKGSSEPVTVISERYGIPVSEHTVVVTVGQESIELKHRNHSLETVAENALLAAQWLSKRRGSGIYAMCDYYDEVFKRGLTIEPDPGPSG